MDKKKIESTLRLAAKTGQLVLNFQKLDALPPELEKLDDLTELRVRGNKLTTLPDWAAKWTGLREIDVGENPRMTALPKWVAELRGLKFLSIEGTKIDRLPPRLRKIADDTARMLDAARGAFDDEEEKAKKSSAAKPKAKAKALPRCPWKVHGQIAAANATLDVVIAPPAVAAAWDGRARDERARVVKSRAGQGIADVLATFGGGVATLEPTWEDIAAEAKSPDDAAARIDEALRGGGKDVGEIRLATKALALAPAAVDLRDEAAEITKAKPKLGAAIELDETIVVGLNAGAHRVRRDTFSVRGLDTKVVVIVVDG
jgi:hypothetical protein